ncbi:MAG: UvrD-helicase domain-containing protein [Candidatus Binatia bacterium]
MTILPNLPDRADRERAATTFDRNVVVTAGAGTGKTTLLVNRLVHLLMRNPDPLKITEVVALTFTNKAANEMRNRLRQRLQSYLDSRLDREPGSASEAEVQGEIKSFIGKYHLSKELIDSRSRDALRQIERSEIGTIHSFAATLLRLYPIEAGLDPQFREDDGSWFERHFEEQWAIWLDRELSGNGGRKDCWRRILTKISLEEIRRLTFSLTSETVQLDRLQELCSLIRNQKVPLPVSAWLKTLEDKALRLIKEHPEEKHQVDKLTRAALKLIREVSAHGEIQEGVLEKEKSLVAEKTAGRVKTWAENEFRQAEELVRVARRLCQINRPLTLLLCDLLIPFAQGCRESFVQEGFVSFDALLVRARNLVRDHVSVREEIKQQFKSVLVDEFQDTDPVQYEILLYLAEASGKQAGNWREVRLMPGKIFVVGDPKQSIYAFRRADIEAYLNIIEKIIKAQNGIECRLTTNFRSHEGILKVVNGVFDPLILPREGLQPPYVGIHSPEPLDVGAEVESHPLPFRKVEIRKVETEDGEANADRGRRLEAESLARWLAEEVLGKAEHLDRDHRRGVVQPGHVAILLRTMTHVHQYLEPLRRRGIRYIVEGERHFYAAQEVIDAVNLLRAVENPYDRSALVGVLRSPVGGLKDAEILQLHRENLLNYRNLISRKAGVKRKSLALIEDLYGVLHRLHLETRKIPAGEAVARVFSNLPITILAAQSFSGEQAVANLEKVCRQAEVMGQEGSGTLKEVITRLQRWVGDVKKEGEGALAEENLNAVRILSVHKSKGLEFPVVVLAGCHGAIVHGGELTEVQYDWSTDLVGLQVGEHWNLPGVFLAEKERLRDREEQKRVLYVAMTRAREHLMISCASTERQDRGSFLSMLQTSLGDLSSLRASTLVPAGNGKVEFHAVREQLTSPIKRPKKPLDDISKSDWKPYAQLWQERARNYEAALQSPLFLSPTLLKRQEVKLAEGNLPDERRLSSPTEAMLVGELAHRFLQEWGFKSNPKDFQDQLTPFLDRWLKPTSAGDRRRIQPELEGIFRVFFASQAYMELASANILGREVPLLISWNGQIMEGVIDLIFEKDDQLYLGDYKTDRIQQKDLEQVAAKYRHQVRVYSEAARQSLSREVTGFKLFFLRLGQATQVGV